VVKKNPRRRAQVGNQPQEGLGPHNEKEKTLRGEGSGKKGRGWKKEKRPTNEKKRGPRKKKRRG